MATANLSARSSDVFALLSFVCKAELWESVAGWRTTAAGVVREEEEDGVGSMALLGGMGAEKGAEADETGNGDNGGGGGGKDYTRQRGG